MNHAPFSLSPILFLVYVVSFLLGGVVGHLLSSIAVSSLILATIAGFVPIPLGGHIRYMLAKAFAKFSGADQKVPFAFSYPVRMLIGIVLSCVVSFVFLTLTAAPVNFVSCGFIALVTSIIFSVIMATKLMVK